MRDAVRAFAQAELWPHAARWDKEHHFPKEAHRGLATLGAYGICVPEEFGSDASSLRTTAVKDGDGYVLNGVKQFIPEPRMQLAKSKSYAKRLRDLGQTFALAGMSVAPDGPAFQFIQHVSPGFGACFDCEFIPDVFDQLQPFKPAQMFNGLQCGFHA